MSDAMKAIGGIVGGLAVLFVVGFLVTGGNLAIYRFWAPQFREAQREVFEESQSFVQGKVTYLTRLLTQYESLPPGPQKQAIRLQILEEAATLEDDLPARIAGRIDAIR